MSSTSGTDAQVLSLPKGGGSVQDLCTTFETDLNTGTGSYGLAINVPAGPNAGQPQLRLRYHTGAGNGPVGIGWTTVGRSKGRQTEGGLPSMHHADNRFALPAAANLADKSDTTF